MCKSWRRERKAGGIIHRGRGGRAFFLLVELIAAKPVLRHLQERGSVEKELSEIWDILLDSGIGTKALESDCPGFKSHTSHNQLWDLGQVTGPLCV